MLVAAGFITDAQVQEALSGQRASGRRLGMELIEMGLVSEVQLAQMLSNQLSIPWVSLHHIEFSRELLELLPAQVADEYGVIPVYVRKLRKQGDTLFVAMDDPTNEQALERVYAACSLPVKVMVAPPSEIRHAIDVYYFGRAPRAPLSERPAPGPSSWRPPASSESRPSTVPSSDSRLDDFEQAGASSPESTRGARGGPTRPSGGPAVPEERPPARPEARDAPSEEEIPATPRASEAGAFVTLTLLDGTTVRLPAPGSGRGAPSDQRALTTRDLVAALQAKGEGRDVSALLSESNWETLFAALLSLLVRKGLVADWEFIDEYEKLAGTKGPQE